uniref:ribonuclease H n=1 Tax=Leptobrachium leishanense TaxID=445787 RepID=A0A8C5WJC5_9ANUR
MPTGSLHVDSPFFSIEAAPSTLHPPSAPPPCSPPRSSSYSFSPLHCAFLSAPDLELCVHPDVWAIDEYDVGSISCTPYSAKLKASATPVYHKQYNLSPAKVEGIREFIHRFLATGILRPIVSLYNTPVNPVPKRDGYRFTQDFRSLNEIIIPISPIVPDLPTLLTSLPPNSTHFTVIDLKNAFFSVPVHPDTQHLLAFMFDGSQFSWSVLPMGFIDSPSIFARALRKTLLSYSPPEGSTLLQYVDDLLLCSPSQAACHTDSVALLNHLHSEGHKVSRKKMQFCSTSVEYLGFVLTQGSRVLSLSRIQSLLQLKRPVSKTDMLSFLGMVNFCRHWIPDCSYYDSVLRASAARTAPDQIVWSPDMVSAFDTLKELLATAPALGLPNYKLPFHLYCREDGRTMVAVLAQVHGGALRPKTAFLSKVLPPVVQGMPNCLHSLAACAMAVETVQSLTLGTDTILHTQHNVLHVLRNLSTQHISSQRLSGYETVLTSTSNLSVKYSSVTSAVLNTLLRLREDHEEPRELHDYLPLIQLTTSPRSDLSDTPLEGPDIRHIFVDGSCSRSSDSQKLTGYAVVELPDIVQESASIPSNSSQAAERFALTAACKLFKDLPVTIYTDSRYAFGVVHDFGALWHRRGFTTADGHPISHSDLISDLLSAILLPSRLAVVKCKGHDPVDSFVSRGNHFADATSKAAALSSPTISLVLHPPIVTCYLSPFLLPQKKVLKELQAGATEADVYHWASEGLVKSQEIPPDVRIYEKGGRVGLPAAAAPIFIFSFHGPGHRSPKLTYSEMAKHFSVCNLKAMINSQLSRCLICARNNTHGPKSKTQHLPPANGPFQELQIDFTHMPTAKGNLKYLLVIVDKFSRWPEAISTARENARTVAKILCKELIPRYGCPISMDSDNGPAFTSKITQELVKLMVIQ